MSNHPTWRFNDWRKSLEQREKNRQKQSEQARAHAQALSYATKWSQHIPGLREGPGVDEVKELPLSFQTEPVVGFRIWKVEDFATRAGKEPRLSSIATGRGAGTYSPGRKMEAHCLHSLHEAPWAGCSCGVWALKNEGDLDPTKRRYPEHMAWGQVYLWGRVLETTRGYRAQFAYPKELFVYWDQEELAKSLSAIYGVPVHRCEQPRPPLTAPVQQTPWQTTTFTTMIPTNGGLGWGTTTTAAPMTGISIASDALSFIQTVSDTSTGGQV